MEKDFLDGMGAYLKLGLLFAFLSGILVGLGYLMGGIEMASVFLVMSLAFNFLMYFMSDKIVLMSTGAKQVTEDQYPRLHAIVSNVARTAGIEKPKVAVIDSPQPNAFATGRNEHNAVVAVTTGLMNAMNDEEMEAVIGHEMSHVIHRDMLVMTFAVALATAISFVANMITYSLFWGGYSGRDRREGGGGLALIGAAIAAPIAATLIQLAISRSREFYADEGSAILTKKPSGLISALTKIDAFVRKGTTLDAPPSTSSLWIINPFSRSSLFELFSTHPSTGARIERLEAIQRRLNQAT